MKTAEINKKKAVKFYRPPPVALETNPPSGEYRKVSDEKDFVNVFR